MEIKIATAIATGPTSVAMEHGGEVLMWDTAAYSKSSDRRTPLNSDQIFKEINDFWKTLSQKEQTQYWDLYKEARQVLDNLFDLNDIQEKMQGIVERMYDLESLNKLPNWVKFKSGIRIPADLKESFDEINQEDNYPHRKEKTYLRNEYVDLAVLAISLRLMVPIWAEFIRITKRQVGGNSKELEAYRLLYFSRVNHTPAMQRLLSYVQLTVSTLLGTEVHATAILNGMGTIEFADWMLALTVVRRLSICPINSDNATSNIITNVYQYVKLGVKGSHKKHARKFGGKITVRDDREIGEGGQKKTSAEVYKIKQEVPDGIKVLMQVYANDSMKMLERALHLTAPGVMGYVNPKPAYLDARLQECIAFVKAVPEWMPQPHHIALAQWVLSEVMPPNGISLLSADALKKALAVTQVYLWENEFYDLAALATAQPLNLDENVMIGAAEARSRIPKEIIEDMVKRWPYVQPKGKNSIRQNNIAARAVDEMANYLTKSDWVLCCPNTLVAFVSRGTLNRRFAIPGDIRSTLAQLLLQIVGNPNAQPGEAA